MPSQRDDAERKRLRMEFQQIRVLREAFGAVPDRKFLPEVFQGYATDGKVAESAERVATIRTTRQAFAHGLSPSAGHWALELDKEYARLLAIAAADAKELPSLILDRITPSSPIESDVHYLICLARLPAPRDDELTKRTARALIALHHKLRDAEAIPSRHWPIRVGEIYRTLVERDPALPQAVADESKFDLPEQTLFIEQAEPVRRGALAKALIGRIVAAGKEDWTPELLTVLRYVPREEAVVHLREQWDEPALRDAATRELATNPEPADREKFLAALSGYDPGVIRAALAALKQTTPQNYAAPAGESAALLSAIRGAIATPNAADLRQEAVALLTAWNGLPQPAPEPPQSKPAEIYREYFVWFRKTHPDEAAQLDANSADAEAWTKRLTTIPFDTADCATRQESFRDVAMRPLSCRSRPSRSRSERRLVSLHTRRFADGDRRPQQRRGADVSDQVDFDARRQDDDRHRNLRIAGNDDGRHRPRRGGAIARRHACDDPAGAQFVDADRIIQSRVRTRRRRSVPLLARFEISRKPNSKVVFGARMRIARHNQPGVTNNSNGFRGNDDADAQNKATIRERR
ncbi:MAG: hypothetical protein QM811_20010 [Pirellulales bacterium]